MATIIADRCAAPMTKKNAPHYISNTLECGCAHSAGDWVRECPEHKAQHAAYHAVTPSWRHDSLPKYRGKPDIYLDPLLR